MCEICNHIETYSTVQVNRYDPTRTTTLRNTFVRESNKYFDELANAIKKTVVDEDVFGLQPQINVGANKKFEFLTSPEKIVQFDKWLQEQIDAGLLKITELSQLGESRYSYWTNKYIYDAYKRGLLRGYNEMRYAGYKVPSIDEEGGIEYLMSSSIHYERVGILFIRTYEDLVGVTSQMRSIISRILAQGMIDGDNPRIIAKKLVAAINGDGLGDLGIFDKLGRFIPAKRRAEIIARTEIIRAHHLANIQSYRNWGVAGVSVMAEFKTAGDLRVCQQCLEIEARQENGTKKIYTLDEIEPMIPVHPQCRCVALPVVVDKFGKPKIYT